MARDPPSRLHPVRRPRLRPHAEPESQPLHRILRLPLRPAVFNGQGWGAGVLGEGAGLILWVSFFRPKSGLTASLKHNDNHTPLLSAAFPVGFKEFSGRKTRILRQIGLARQPVHHVRALAIAVITRWWSCQLASEPSRPTERWPVSHLVSSGKDPGDDGGRRGRRASIAKKREPHRGRETGARSPGRGAGLGPLARDDVHPTWDQASPLPPGSQPPTSPSPPHPSLCLGAPTCLLRPLKIAEA